ncbi:MOP flippase family protein [Natronospora cellulosivora (SeqCode)]
MSDFKIKIIKSVKWNSINTLLTTIISPLTLVILARLLSPIEFGYISIITIILGISKTISEMGFSQGIIKEEEICSKDLSSIFWFEVFLGFFVFSIVFFSSGIIAGFFNEVELTYLIRYTALVFLIEPFSLVFKALLEKEIKYKQLQIANIVRLIITNGIKIALAILGFGAFSVVYANIIAAFFFATALFTMFTKNKLWLPELCFSIERVKPYLKFGIFISAKSILHTFSKRIDEILIGRVLGSELLGLYYFAKNIITRLYILISNPISQLAFPLLAKYRSDQIRFKDVFIKITGYLAAIGIPAFVGVALTSQYFVPLVFGDIWIEATPILVILSAWGAVKSIEHNMPSRALYCFGKSDYVFYLSFLDLIIRLLIMFMAALHSIELMAFTFFAVEFLKYIAWIIILKRLSSITLLSIWQKVNRYILYSLFMAIFLYIFSINIYITNLVNLIINILMGIMIYLICFYIFSRKDFQDIMGNIVLLK